MDEEVLHGLFSVAVDDAAPGEVMPPVAGPPGWTARRREAFLAWHRARRPGLAGPLHECTFAITYDGKIVGSARLARHDSHDVLETGMWLARSERGRGIGTAALRKLLDEAANAGARTVIAETTADNPAALAALRHSEARLTTHPDSAHVHARLAPDRTRPDVLTDPAFLTWARSLCEDLRLGLGGINATNDFLAFLWRTFADNGEVPSDRVAPLIQRRRIELAQYYMRHFIAQAGRETGLDIKETMSSSPPDNREPTGLTQVGDISIQGIHRADIFRDTAEAVQEYVMARYWTVWPQCPTHRLGYHPVLTDATPQWECSSGGHRKSMLEDGA